MTLDPDVRPVLPPAHRSPFAMKDKVKAELDRMQKLGVITLVSEPMDRVSSTVATNKKDKDEIRIYINPGDLNASLKRPHHPMCTVEEVIPLVLNAAVFILLDAKNSLWQMSLDDKLSMLTTFSTYFGHYRFSGCHLDLTLPVRCFSVPWSMFLQVIHVLSSLIMSWKINI